MVNAPELKLCYDQETMAGEASSNQNQGGSDELDVARGPQQPSLSPEDEAARLLLRPVLQLASLARHGRKACLLLFDALALYLEDALLDDR